MADSFSVIIIVPSRDWSIREVATPFKGIHTVFLDRDGVINRKLPEGQYIAHWDEFCILPGTETAIANLNREGIRVIVVSNQRGIALGHITRADVDLVHFHLQRHLATAGAHIDAFYYCPHDRNQCECRKPKTGLFHQAFRDFPDVPSLPSLVIGDSLPDLQAAHALHLPAIFIEGDPSTRKAGWRQAVPLADAVADSLFNAVQLILS